MGGIVETIFGGGAPEAEEIEDPGHDYGTLWSTYSGWVTEENTRYTNELASTRANMAASGIRSNTEAWNDRLASVERGHEKRMGDIAQTETGRLLERNWRAQGGGDNMQSWYEQQFGPMSSVADGGGEPSESAANARAAAGRATTPSDDWLAARGGGDDLWLRT